MNRIRAFPQGTRAQALTLINNAEDRSLIKERFQDEFIEIFGIDLEVLTANEAHYLVGFRSPDEIRD